MAKCCNERKKQGVELINNRVARLYFRFDFLTKKRSGSVNMETKGRRVENNPLALRSLRAAICY